jgi:hypothetical protein
MCNATAKFMIEKISRDICLIKFRQFPLRDFVKDQTIFFYPKVYSRVWCELKDCQNYKLAKTLSTEITKLYRSLEVENLTFFCDYNRNWISKFTEQRKDYKPLMKSVEYFEKNKINKRFNGAVKVNLEELEEFIKHFYVITKCDSEFAYYHFTDEKENILGHIHYSGEVCFDILNEKMEKVLLEKLAMTKFVKKV